MSEEEAPAERPEALLALAQVLIENLLAHLVRGDELTPESVLLDCLDLDIFDADAPITEAEVRFWAGQTEWSAS